ncbi:hypothetical protein SDC9_72907 [bioreactor metagenome]|uniref:Uncharacterized protein n=1 Tax=bioreactor metagenome TaxID=1076179 RepID=A0A644YCX6_9ZZZZ
MYRNSRTGEVISDEDVDVIVSGFAEHGLVGRSRESVIQEVFGSGYEYVNELADEVFEDTYADQDYFDE